MNKNEWKKSIGVIGRVLLAYAFIFAQGAWATQNQGTKDKSGPPQKAAAQQLGENQSSVAATEKVQSKQAQGEESESSVAEEKSSGDGRHEGIKVHGHWTIEVRNPDGAVVTHREFENSLEHGLGQGSQFLASVLGRQGTVGTWTIVLGSNANAALNPCINGVAPAPCLILEASSGQATAAYAFATSTISVASNGSLVLSGTMVAGQNGVIDNVGTTANACGPTTTPATCNYVSSPVPVTNNYAFTGAFLSPAVNVSLGQTVAVTVTFSFS